MKKIIKILLAVSLSFTFIQNIQVIKANERINIQNKLSDFSKPDNPLGWNVEDVNVFSDFLEEAVTFEVYNNVNMYNGNVKAVSFINSNTEEIVLNVNNKLYTLYEENEDVYLKNENGNSLLILDFEVTNISNASRATNGAYVSDDDHLYTNDIGPFTKTGRYVIDILSFISDVTGYLIEHPILGKIYIATSIAKEVMAQSGYMTSYIKFWQANKKTDMSYVREKQEWYSSSSYSSSSFLKTYTRYFDTARP